MPQLRRNAAPLLTQHLKSSPEAPTALQEISEQPQIKEEQIDRSPESSEDEGFAAAAAQYDGTSERAAAKAGAAATRNRDGMSRATARVLNDIANRSRAPRASRQSLRSIVKDEEPLQAGRKRRSDEISKSTSANDADDDVPDWMNQSSAPSRSQPKSQSRYSSQSMKNRSNIYKGVDNVHGSPASETSTPRDKKPRAGFVQPGVGSSPSKHSQGQARFYLPTPPASSPSQGSTSTNKPFRRPKHALDEDIGANKSNRKRAAFQQPRRLYKRSRSQSPKIPTITTIDLASDDDDSPLSSASSALSTPPPDGDLSDEELAFAAAQTENQRDLARCPICQEYVDKEGLELFARGERLGWRDKQAFCDSHKRRDAERTWREKGWPDIDWDTEVMEARMGRQHPEMDAVIEGRRESTYLQALKSKVGTGRIRKALRDVNEARKEILTPGYYGPRGSQVMQVHLMAVFGPKLGDKATKGDAVVRATGATNYISSVLVPEIAVLMIKEDMGCDEQRAKEIMDQSAEVGRLINAVEEDDVHIKEEKL